MLKERLPPHRRLHHQHFQHRAALVDEVALGLKCPVDARSPFSFSASEQLFDSVLVLCVIEPPPTSFILHVMISL
jgi:hypothetical protein